MFLFENMQINVRLVCDVSVGGLNLLSINRSNILLACDLDESPYITYIAIDPFYLALTNIDFACRTPNVERNDMLSSCFQ